MDNKITKQRIDSHMEYDWYKYIFILLASILLCYFISHQINFNRDFEEIQLFSSAYARNDSDYETKVYEALHAKNDNLIRSLNVENVSCKDKNYPTLLSTHGSVNSDLIILGKNSLPRMYGAFIPFTDELLDKVIPADLRDSIELYYPTGDDLPEDFKATPMAIRLDNLPNINKIFDFKSYDKEAEESLTNEKEFYMVINSSSVNIGTYGKKEKYHKYDQVFTMLYVFFDMYGRA